MTTTPEQAGDSFGTFLETVQAPAHVISGQRVYSDPGDSVYVYQEEVYYHNFLYPDGISLTELRGLILQVDMAHDEHVGTDTITPGNLVLDAFKAMALELAELRRNIDLDVNAPPPLYPMDEEGRLYRETRIEVLENMQHMMDAIFQREG